MTDVWLVEPAGYDSFVTGVFATAEGAITGIKEDYAPPYIVEWKPVEHPDDDTFLVYAHFEGVQGYSVKHDACWEIKRWEVR